MPVDRLLKKGEYFTAKQVDEGQFRFAMVIAEFKGADEWVIAFKDGCPYVMQEHDIDPIVVEYPLEVPKAGFVFKGEK